MIISHSISSLVHRLAHAESDTLGEAIARVALHRGRVSANQAQAKPEGAAAERPQGPARPVDRNA